MGALWRGDIRLPVSFWVYGYVIPFFIGLVFAVLGFELTPGSLSAQLYVVGVLCYAFFWGVGTWRSANKYEGAKIWATAAKIWIAFPLVVLIAVMVVVGGAMTMA